MSDQLFQLLTDSRTGPREKLRALAVQAREALNAVYVEIRIDGLDSICLGEKPETVFSLQIGSGLRPLGRLDISPAPRDGQSTPLAAYVHCAELIHRLQAGYIDNLTGLYNRRGLDLELASIAFSAGPVAVAMLDIDHFKRVNDTYGHEGGDEVLRQFASRLAECLPAGGFLARYGGEEFCVILRDLEEDPAAAAVESMRVAVSGSAIPFRKQDIRITSSAGVAAGSGRSVHQLLSRADQALYAAKESGRNQMVRSGELGKRGAAKLFRRRFQRVFDRPLYDLGWFGRRVIGLDRSADRLACVDYFGGVIPVSGSIPDCISFVRVGKKTFGVPAHQAGAMVLEFGRRVDPGPASLDPVPEFRRVQYDVRMNRLYWIERQGRSIYGTDLSLTRYYGIRVRIDERDEERPRGFTAVLPLGDNLLLLEALGRRIVVLDRSSLSLKQIWSLPPDGYELCLCYLPESKLVLAGGSTGMKLLSLDGKIVEESDRPVVSAYSHPFVGLVLSTPAETVMVR